MSAVVVHRVRGILEMKRLQRKGRRHKQKQKWQNQKSSIIVAAANEYEHEDTSTMRWPKCITVFAAGRAAR